MNFKHLLFALLPFLASIPSLAQKEAYNKLPEYLKANNVWAFGHYAGLDFRSGTAVPINTRQFAEKGCATVSDPETGKPLFYSNGNMAWRGNRSPMYSAQNLLCIGNRFNGDLADGSKFSTAPGITKQGVCIVPEISKPGRYYIFSMSEPISYAPTKSTLHYGIFDRSVLSNDLGDVTINCRVLDTTELSGAMIAIPGNHCDVWLLVLDRKEHKYKAYHITAKGIDPKPVVSDIGKGFPSNANASMVVSSDRTRICLVSGVGGTQFLLEQFDPETGKVKNDMMLGAPPAVLDSLSWNPVSAIFSPDNSKLYVHVFNAHVGDASNNGIYQYNLSKYDSTAIDLSRKFIGAPSLYGKLIRTFPNYNDVNGPKINVPDSNTSLLRLYNDTIYMGMNGNIHRINRPNLLGTACNLELNAIQLLPGDTCTGNFGSEVVFPMPVAPIVAETKKVYTCKSNPSVTLEIPEAYEGMTSYTWEDGSTDPVRHINKLGKYWVMAKNYCPPKADTFIVLPFDYPQPVIKGDTQLGTTVSYYTYQWMLDGQLIAGAQDSILNVKKNGNYRVIVQMEDCIDTSDVYKVTNAGGGSGINDMDVLSNNLSVYPNPATNSLSIYPNVKVNICITSIEGKVMLKERQVNSVSVQEFAAGIYFLQVLDDADRILKVLKFTIVR